MIKVLLFTLISVVMLEVLLFVSLISYSYGGWAGMAISMLDEGRCSFRMSQTIYTINVSFWENYDE